MLASQWYELWSVIYNYNNYDTYTSHTRSISNISSHVLTCNERKRRSNIILYNIADKSWFAMQVNMGQSLT